MAVIPRLPVVMYHGIGQPLQGWLWNHLITRVDLFEKQLTLLDRNGYDCLSLDDFRERQEAGQAGQKREVVLTFDDGYLDNWVFAYPVLKKLGWQGTIYVNPDFVDPGETPRPTLEDVWSGKLAMSDLSAHGFLNRAELRLLQASGVMTIGSHSNSHTWYATGPAIVDFHRPGLSTPWLAWNSRPDRKHAYLTENQDDLVPWGTPIHENGRSLGIRRYFPAPEISAAATAFVADRGGAAFFDTPDWRAQLEAALPGETGQGAFETDADMMARFREEIFGGKAFLEEIIGEEVRHFCWPGGAYCDESWPLAAEAGHTTICVSRRDRPRWNDDDPALVRRIGSGDLVFTPFGKFLTDSPSFMHLNCEMERGVPGLGWRVKLLKLWTATKAGFSPLKT